MLLISIGALSTGWNMNVTINEVYVMTPFDYSLSLQYPWGKHPKQMNNEQFQAVIDKLGISDDPNIRNRNHLLASYMTKLQSDVHSFSKYVSDKELRNLINTNELNTSILVVPLSDFNYVLEKTEFQTLFEIK